MFLSLLAAAVAGGPQPAAAAGTSSGGIRIAGPRHAAAPRTAPARPKFDAPAGPTTDRAERSKRAAGPLVIATVAGLVLIVLALSIWTIHWGQRLRRGARRPRGAGTGESADPWVVSGQRLQSPDATDEQEERP